MDDLSKSYQVLGLKPDASPEEVKQAYRDMVKVWHPDRFAHDDRLRVIAQDKLKEINGAYELLKAHAFESSIKPEPIVTPEPKPEPATATPSPVRSRATPWTILGALGLVLVAAAAFLFFRNGRVQQAAAPLKTNAVVAAIPLPRSDAGYSLSFNGNHSRFTIATTGSLTGTFTVEFWALTRQPRGGTMVSSRAPGDWAFDVKFREGKRFHSDIGDGSRWLARNANVTFGYKRDTWYHLAYVVTPDGYNIYFNGRPAGSGEFVPAGNPLLYDADHQLRFGLDRMDTDDLNGCLAEIRVWKTARTQREVESNLNRTMPEGEPGLLGYWNFTEGSGTTVRDGSGHGLTGKLIGDVSWSTSLPPGFHR